MNFLDLHTVVFATGAMGALMSLVVYFQRLNYPPSFKGLSHWTLGPLVAFLSTLLFGLRDVIPAVVSTGLANLLLFLAGALLLSGTCRFLGRPLPGYFMAGMLILSMPPMWWLSQTDTQYPSRLVFICAVMSMLFGTHAYVVWRHAPSTFANRFMLVVVSTLTLVMLVRGITALQERPTGGLFTPSLLQSIYIMSYSFGMLLITVASMLMASERVRRELEHLVTHDSLTGALARRALFERGEKEIARSRRNGSPMSVLMLDLDHFKDINDQHGHHIGDLVLRDFVQRTLAELRQADLLGRYGGEEFVVLLPDTNTEQALHVAERIRASTRTDARLPACSVSIGLSTLTMPSADKLDNLIDRADAGLYRAKALGRNRVETDATTIGGESA